MPLPAGGHSSGCRYPWGSAHGPARWTRGVANVSSPCHVQTRGRGFVTGTGTTWATRRCAVRTTRHDTSGGGVQGAEQGAGAVGGAEPRNLYFYFFYLPRGGGGRCGGPLRRASPGGAACGGQGLCSLSLAGRDFRVWWQVSSRRRWWRGRTPAALARCRGSTDGPATMRSSPPSRNLR